MRKYAIILSAVSGVIFLAGIILSIAIVAGAAPDVMECPR